MHTCIHTCVHTLNPKALDPDLFMAINFEELSAAYDALSDPASWLLKASWFQGSEVLGL